MAVSQEQQIQESVSAISRKVEETIKFVESQIGVTRDIPVLRDIKDMSALYDYYRDVVIGYNKICDSVAYLSTTQIRLRQLKRVLNNSSLLPSIKGTVKNMIESALNDIDLCRQSAVVLKDSYDAHLRFYGSAQYMLSSSRYNEVNH